MKFIVLSIYVSNNVLDRKAFFTKNLGVKIDLKEKNIIMIKDFNCKLDEKYRCFDTSTHHFKSISKQYHFILKTSYSLLTH